MKKLLRREFCSIATLFIGSTISGVLGIIFYGYSVGQAVKSSKIYMNEQWISIGSIDDFEEDKPIRKTLKMNLQDGWVNLLQEESVWVIKNLDSITVYSGTCPHLGCKVQWQERANEHGFFCPCHSSFFDKQGLLVKGVAARGLDTLEWRKNINGEVEVNFKKFKPLLNNKVEQI